MKVRKNIGRRLRAIIFYDRVGYVCKARFRRREPLAILRAGIVFEVAKADVELERVAPALLRVSTRPSAGVFRPEFRSLTGFTATVQYYPKFRKQRC